MKCNYHTTCPYDAVVFYITKYPDTHLGPTPDELNALCEDHKLRWNQSRDHHDDLDGDTEITEELAICWLVMES